jgi:hypothetical protein
MSDLQKQLLAAIAQAEEPTASTEHWIRTANVVHRRIAERHTPDEEFNDPELECIYCSSNPDGHRYAIASPWPCPDWRDVASIYGVGGRDYT